MDDDTWHDTRQNVDDLHYSMFTVVSADTMREIDDATVHLFSAERLWDVFVSAHGFLDL